MVIFQNFVSFFTLILFINRLIISISQLPPELQAKVRSYIASKQRKLADGNGNQTKADVKTIKVPIPTFPPTAMVYSLGSGIIFHNDFV